MAKKETKKSPKKAPAAKNKTGTSKKAQHKGTSQSYVFPVEVDITTAPLLRDQLLELLDSAKVPDLQLNLSKVEKLTTPGAQALLAANAMAKAKSGQLTITHISETATQSLQTLGLSNHFSSPSNE